MRAATAAAEPPLDPPGVRSVAHGLRTGPYAEFSFDDPIANSSQLVLPTMIAPADSSLSTTVASYGGWNVSRILDEAVVRTPHAQVVLESDRHAGERSERRAGGALLVDQRGARDRALGDDEVEGVERGLVCSMRSSDARQISTADVWPLTMASRIPRAVVGVIR